MIFGAAWDWDVVGDDWKRMAEQKETQIQSTKWQNRGEQDEQKKSIFDVRWQMPCFDGIGKEWASDWSKAQKYCRRRKVIFDIYKTPHCSAGFSWTFDQIESSDFECFNVQVLLLVLCVASKLRIEMNYNCEKNCNEREGKTRWSLANVSLDFQLNFETKATPNSTTDFLQFTLDEQGSHSFD